MRSSSGEMTATKMAEKRFHLDIFALVLCIPPRRGNDSLFRLLSFSDSLDSRVLEKHVLPRYWMTMAPKMAAPFIRPFFHFVLQNFLTQKPNRY